MAPAKPHLEGSPGRKGSSEASGRGGQPSRRVKSKGISPEAGSIRYLSGSSRSYGRVGKFTTRQGASPTFWSACQTPGGIRRKPGASSEKESSAKSWKVGDSGRPS